MRHVGQAVSIAVSSLALVCCSHAGKAPTARQPSASAKPPVQTTAPPPSAAARRSESSTPPSASPAPGSTAAPSSPPTSPLASQAGAPLTPGPRSVTRLPADAAPRILDVAVSETTVKPGDRIFGRVVTTSNVATVEARIGGYAVSLAKVGVGRFELAYTVGSLPWFVHGNFTMQLTARNTRGDAVTRAVPLTVR
jgi:hypothetical protein